MTGATASLLQLHKHPAQQTQTYSGTSVCRLFLAKFETILKKKVLAHLFQFSLLTSRQHGFLLQRSTLANLLVGEEMITKWLDEGSSVDLNYPDFSEAFDSVNHRLLLAKLRGYGIAPVAISWIECFPNRRTFQLNVYGTLS